LTTTTLLKQRRKQHGDFTRQFEVAQQIKTALWSHERLGCFHNIVKETLEMISTKLSRIVTGNPNNADHWRDIAGYATLMVNLLEGKTALGVPKDNERDFR
jgi:hypothetical protein